jgi:hypothetical protein
MSDQEAGPIDRGLQRELLLAMRDCYPEPLLLLPEPHNPESPKIRDARAIRADPRGIEHQSRMARGVRSMPSLGRSTGSSRNH